MNEANKREMIVADLYVASPHAFPEDCWGGGRTDCRRCGIHLNSVYDDEAGCRGPWWMQLASSIETQGAG